MGRKSIRNEGCRSYRGSVSPKRLFARVSLTYTIVSHVGRETDRAIKPANQRLGIQLDPTAAPERVS